MKLCLAENIRACRKQRRMTMEQLAEAMGVTTGAVYKWEAGLSVPDVELIMALADFFEISVDALLGYRIRANSLDAIAARLNECCKSGDPAALQEAEAALQKYPNSFEVVYGCAQVYAVFGSGGHDRALLCRAKELFEQSLLLISQNDDPNVSEYTIYGVIGEIWIIMGEPEKGVELLKKHNTAGMFDDAISDTLSLLMHRPEEAKPFLFGVLLRIVDHLESAVIGYALVHGAKGDWQTVRELVLWGLEALRGLQKEGARGYLDKRRAILLILLAQAQLHGGAPEQAQASLREAAAIARVFDAAPDYGVSCFRFAEGTETGSVHDALGGTVRESASFLLEHLQDPALRKLWEETEQTNEEVSQ